MRITGPKFVKHAQAWCVSIFQKTTKGESQKQEWFSTETEAQEFIEQKEREGYS